MLLAARLPIVWLPLVSVGKSLEFHLSTFQHLCSHLRLWDVSSNADSYQTIVVLLVNLTGC
jgi:hypothetical protein